jgi:C4-dicarboxylate transporter DctM subunit
VHGPRKTGEAFRVYAPETEDIVTALALLAIVLLPIIEVVGRALIGVGVPGSIDYVRHLTLWVAFLGAAVAARQEKHLALGFASFLRGRWRVGASMLAGSVATAVTLILAWASLDFVRLNMQSVATVGGFIPEWVVQVIMPLGFFLIGLRFFWRTAENWWGRLTTLPLIVLVLAMGWWPEDSRIWLLLPAFTLLLVAAVAGTPIFVVLGGLASLFFFVDVVPLASIPVEAYRIASNPILPTIPLFTLAGTILAEGKASERLARLFHALFGWVPGGTAVATIGVCAFFTTFTGGSGVTILALGGLMLPVLLREGYRERFSLGALTASGSLGILLPPSLVIILYGVSAHVAIDKLFLAGVLPGLLMIVLFAAYAVYRSWQLKSARSHFELRETLIALWQAKWEVLLPVAILFGIFSGYATLVEIAGLTAVYVLILEFLVHRDLSLRHDLARLLVEAAVMIGGIMIILACAMGLTSYLIYADVPTRATAWVQAGIASPWVFLLALNVFLLIAGFLVDIFSALVVIVPLILPIALAFGIDPVHLGIIFLANMELGYLTPPVGLNLFLASFRFERPLMEIWVASLPFFFLLVVAVLIITFVPALSIGVVKFIGL